MYLKVTIMLISYVNTIKLLSSQRLTYDSLYFKWFC